MSFRFYVGRFRAAYALAQLIAVVSIALIATPSHACSCAFDVEKGFIHANEKGESILPANAKGTLFLVPVAPSGYLNVEDHLYLLSNPLATPLQSKDFVITDSSDKKTLKAVVEKVTPHSANDRDSPSTDRYFVFKDPLDEACYRGDSNARCPKINDRYENRPTIADLQTKGELNEITTALQRATGLFRISPQGGFQEGNTYTIATSIATPSSARNTSKITVRVAAALQVSAADRFLLEAPGKPHLQYISFPMGGSCSESVPAIAQDLGYIVPPNYAPYRESMVFFTERLEKEAPVGQGSRKFFAYITSQSLCSQIKFGGSEFGTGKERVTTTCESGHVGPPAQMRGKVGFLEMSDELHLTPTVAVDFGQQWRCLVQSFLKRDARPGPF